MARGTGFRRKPHDRARAHGRAEGGSRSTATAVAWSREVPDFHTLAVECVAGPDARLVAAHGGLPDDAFEHDGKLTKREFRALALAKLMPHPGALLWDIGAGCGSVGIEWMRAADHAHAIALEPRAERRAMAARNAVALGVSGLDLRDARAPAGADGASRSGRDLHRRRTIGHDTMRIAVDRLRAGRPARRTCRDAGERVPPACRVFAARRGAGAIERRAGSTARRFLRLAAADAGDAMGVEEAMSGRLYGIGVGPGDPELMTLKAVRILGEAPVIAYPAPDSGESSARAIAEKFIPAGRIEIAIRVPMRVGPVPLDAYERAAGEIAAHLEEGRDVAVLCEGDPFFYGSFMYLHDALAHRFPTIVVPGVSSLTACAAASATPARAARRRADRPSRHARR